MDIGSVSSNTFINQIGLQAPKQTQQTDSHDDANIVATLENSQNVGNNAERTVEDSSESDSSNSTESESNKNEEDTGTVLDEIV